MVPWITSKRGIRTMSNPTIAACWGWQRRICIRSTCFDTSDLERKLHWFGWLGWQAKFQWFVCWSRRSHQRRTVKRSQPLRGPIPAIHSTIPQLPKVDSRIEEGKLRMGDNHISPVFVQPSTPAMLHTKFGSFAKTSLAACHFCGMKLINPIAASAMEAAYIRKYSVFLIGDSVQGLRISRMQMAWARRKSRQRFNLMLHGL